MALLDRLKLPEVRGSQNLDDLELSKLHLQIIKRKGFLRRLYVDFYKMLIDAIEYNSDRTVLELGSGGGFIKELYPMVITSDVLELPTVDNVFSACQMPFNDHSLDAIIMVDVFHHIPDVRAFFRGMSKVEQQHASWLINLKAKLYID